MLTPPPNLLKEAIYLYGPLGSAKTTFHATIAEQYRRTNTPGIFHVVCTERERVPVALEAFPGWQANTVLYDCDDWPSVLQASEKIHADASTDDWIVVDTIGFVKDWIRTQWFTANLNTDWEDFKMSGKSMQEVQSHDWTRMNSNYERWCRRFMMGFPGHRLAVAQATELAVVTKSGSDWDKGHTRDTYGRHGLKPDAYKGDDSFFHTVLLANQARREPQKFELTTVKDRPGRVYLDHQQVDSLADGGAWNTYMSLTAGWVDA